MGQYHYTVSMDAKEYLDPYYLGAGLKEWEQSGGCYPSALAFLLSHRPGNMPADVGGPVKVVAEWCTVITPASR